MISGFTFRQRHSSEFGIIIKSKNVPSKPAVRVEKVKVLGKSGTYKFEDANEDMVFEFECIISGRNILELEQKMGQISAWISEKGPLVIDYMPDKNFEVKMYEALIPRRYSRYFVFDLVFEGEAIW